MAKTSIDRKTACTILGVPYAADKEKIKAAYKKKTKLLHPDNNPSESAKAAYILVCESYEYLMSQPEVREIGGDAAFSKRRSEQGDLTYRRTMHEKMDREAEKRRRRKRDDEERTRKEIYERRQELKYKKAKKEIDYIVMARRIEQAIEEAKKIKIQEENLYKAFEKHYEEARKQVDVPKTKKVQNTKAPQGYLDRIFKALKDTWDRL